MRVSTNFKGPQNRHWPLDLSGNERGSSVGSSVQESFAVGVEPQSGVLWFGRLGGISVSGFVSVPETSAGFVCWCMGSDHLISISGCLDPQHHLTLLKEEWTQVATSMNLSWKMPFPVSHTRSDFLILILLLGSSSPILFSIDKEQAKSKRGSNASKSSDTCSWQCHLCLSNFSQNSCFPRVPCFAQLESGEGGTLGWVEERTFLLVPVGMQNCECNYSWSKPPLLSLCMFRGSPRDFQVKPLASK